MSEIIDDQRKITNKYKLAAAFVTLLAAAYGLYQEQSGDATFSLIVALLLFISLDPQSSINPLVALKKVGNYSFATLYELATVYTRGLFQYGDKFVRAMMILLALGGTAAITKYGIRNFSMFPDVVDMWVKRLGPAIAIISIVVYPASLTSKRIFKLSMHQKDNVVRRHELRFYISVILFSTTVFALFAGCQVEQWRLIETSRTGGPYSIGGYEPSTIRLMISLSLIWLVWAISFGACILSRFLEWQWREANAQGSNLQEVGSTGGASA